MVSQLRVKTSTRHQYSQCRLILAFGIEHLQPFALGGTEQTLVRGDQDEIVAETERFGMRGPEEDPTG